MGKTFSHQSESRAGHDRSNRKRRDAYLDKGRELAQKSRAQQSREWMQEPERLRADEEPEEPIIEQPPDGDELEWLADEMDGDHASREPADGESEEEGGDFTPATVPPRNPMVVDPVQGYWLEVTEGIDGAMHCHFRQPDWRFSDDAVGDARKKVTALLTTLAAWLEQHGGDFLRHSTPEHYAQMQGSYSSDIKSRSIVTQTGLLWTLLEWLRVQKSAPWSEYRTVLLAGKTASGEAAKDANRQTELGNALAKSWLIWPQQQAFPLWQVVKSREYATAWVVQVLQLYDEDERTKTNWLRVIMQDKKGDQYAYITEILKNSGTDLEQLTRCLKERQPSI